MVNVAKNGLLESKQPNIKYNQKDCSFCILDGTDACSRGAGRAIDDTICDDFLEDMSIAEFAIMELEQVRAEIEENGVWVRYNIEGRTDRDIENIVEAVLKQAKESFIYRLDKHISKLKGEQE